MSDPSIFGLLGSGRGEGHTGTIARAVFDRLDDARLFDLDDVAVGPYRYDYANEDDDFLPLAFKMTRARAIVFASPVYWYSMSGPMKLFFDRLTDLTETHKTWGKSLAGKTMFVIASGEARAARRVRTALFGNGGLFRHGVWRHAVRTERRDRRRCGKRLRRAHPRGGRSILIRRAG